MVAFQINTLDDLYMQYWSMTVDFLLIVLGYYPYLKKEQLIEKSKKGIPFFLLQNFSVISIQRYNMLTETTLDCDE